MRKTILTLASAMIGTAPSMAATTPVPTAPPPAYVHQIPLVQQTAQDRKVYQRQSYNYEPAVLHDGGTYHMYWCGGIAGDYVLHAQSRSPQGPFVSSTASLAFMHSPFMSPFYDIALSPTKNVGNFDGVHTCDPDVIKVAGTFFMYYDGSNDGTMGSIGVAASGDGVHFFRVNGGAAVVPPARTNPSYVAEKLTYGAGQASVFYLAPYVYMTFTDTTGSGANPGNGAGQFVLRSTNPTFASNVQELTGQGWVARAFGKHTSEFSILGSFAMDWAYDAASKSVVVATDRQAGHTTILFMDPSTFSTIGQGDLPLDWRDGPAILTEADKTMAPRPDCASMSITAYTGAGSSNDPFTWTAIAQSTGQYSMTGLCGRAGLPVSVKGTK